MKNSQNIRDDIAKLRVAETKAEETLNLIRKNIQLVEEVLKVTLALESVSHDNENETHYNKSGSWSEKLLGLLSMFKSLTPPEAAVYLKSFEEGEGNKTHQDFHYLNICSQYLPKLYREGLVKREKTEGRSYTYKHIGKK